MRSDSLGNGAQRSRCLCVHAKRRGVPPASESLLLVEPDTVAVETVKETEFEPGALHIRLGEYSGHDGEYWKALRRAKGSKDGLPELRIWTFSSWCFPPRKNAA
jgi:hypothetical protein